MPEKFDLIVVGAGIAGLCAALEAAKHDKSVAMLDRFDSKKSNSYFAQGGIAAAIDKNDSWKSHAQDTIRTGCGLCDERAVNFITKNGPAEVRELIDLGLRFDGDKNPELGLEGGHSQNRVLHIKGDQTGKEMTTFLKKLAKENGNIHFFEKTALKEILTAKGAYAGIGTFKNDELLFSNSLVLATGGYGAVFEKTTNPHTTVGMGIGIANSAGCELTGMEFVQFHPTTLRSKVGGNFLVTEAVRGEGGKIVDVAGKQITNPLDTRDKVSIAIYNEIAAGREVFLDARELETENFEERFPSVFLALKKHKINPEEDLIPIEAAAHYTIGGIRTTIDSNTNIRRIYAAGECSHSGLHGANRLASNSLLEGLVMGKVAGKSAAGEKANKGIFKAKPAQPIRSGIPTKTAYDAMRKVMWRCCGIVRNKIALQEGLAGIVNMQNKIEQTGSIESFAVRDALRVCKKTFEAAIARKESVGTHYRIN